MSKKITYSIRMSVMVTWTSLVIFGTVGLIVRLQTHKLSEGHLKKVVIEISNSKATETETTISQNIVAIQVLAKAIEVIHGSPESINEQTGLLVKSFLKDYPSISKIDLSKQFALSDTNEFVFKTTYQSTDGEISSVQYQVDESQNVCFQNLLNGSTFSYSDPAWETQTENGVKRRLIMTISMALDGGPVSNNYLLCEIDLSQAQQLIENYSAELESTVALLTSNGTIIAHTNDKIIQKQLNELQPEFDTEFSLSSLLKIGKDSVIFNKKLDSERICFSYAPINIQGIDKIWGLIILTPEKVLMQQTRQIQKRVIIMFVLGIVLLTFLVYQFTRIVSSSIIGAIAVLKRIAIGDTQNIELLHVKSNDEISEMAESVNKLIDGFEKTAHFANEIGKGNLDIKFEALSQNDALGNALLNMRTSLVHAQYEEQKRKAEDEKLNWATHGIAKFGEVLRGNANNIKELSYQIMSNLIDYLNANQGALFVINNNDENNITLELTSAIAYGRDKFIKRTIGIGEELVGRCAFERKSIYMTDIPQDYIQITSGLGTANPKALLLVPLVLNDEIFGVLELASFNHFETYQIEFVEKIAESIASTISNVKVNELTTKLLEQSRLQAEELASQEEEMRQNMEELQATQEEAQRREHEMTAMINALSLSAFIVEYNMESVVLSVNKKYADFLGRSIDEIVGQKHSDGYEFTDEIKSEYDQFWHNLKQGITQYQTNKVNFNGRRFWFYETYVPIINVEDGLPYKILKISYDITEQKEKELQMLQQQKEIEQERILIQDYIQQIELLNLQLAQQKKLSDVPQPKQQALLNETEILKQEIEQYKERINALEANAKINEDKVTNNASQQVQHPDISDHLLLEWTGELDMGIDEIDQQHEQLVRLINLIDQSYIQEKTKKEIKDNIRNFIDFVSYHFGTEEAYFVQFGFELADEHIADHKLFIKELSKIQNDYASGKKIDLTEPLLFIRRWLLNHINKIDQKYKSLFNKNGLS